MSLCLRGRFLARSFYGTAGLARTAIATSSTEKQQAFLDFVLSHYVAEGVDERDQDKLTPLLRLRYHGSIADALADLGNAPDIRAAFTGFQRHLYQPPA